MGVPPAETPSRSLGRRGFIGLLAGGAAVGVASGYALSRALATTGEPLTVHLCAAGRLHALRATNGAVRWTRPLELLPEAVPAVDEGRSYVTTGDGYLYAFDAGTGAVRWRRRTGGQGDGNPAAADGVVYVAPGDGYVHALDAASGAVRWRRYVGGGVAFSPVLSGGLVYAGSVEYYVYALDARTGIVRWRTGNGTRPDPADRGVSPSVDGRLVLAMHDGTIVALDARTGARRRTLAGDGLCGVHGGRLFTASAESGLLQAVDVATGGVRWKYQVKDAAFGPATVVNDLLYIGLYNRLAEGGSDAPWIGSVEVLDVTTGRPRWRYGVPDLTGLAAPAVAARTVYVTCGNSLYALNATTGRPYWIHDTGGDALYARPVVT